MLRRYYAGCQRVKQQAALLALKKNAETVVCKMDVRVGNEADHARWAETIPYEILCAIGARVPRVGRE